MNLMHRDTWLDTQLEGEVSLLVLGSTLISPSDWHGGARNRTEECDAGEVRGVARTA